MSFNSMAAAVVHSDFGAPQNKICHCFHFFSFYRIEYNRIGKTRELFKKIRDNKRTFHAKMGTIKDKKYGPNRSTDIRKRWQEYTELYK